VAFVLGLETSQQIQDRGEALLMGVPAGRLRISWIACSGRRVLLGAARLVSLPFIVDFMACPRGI
jgi:hypothetical protein